MYYPSADPLAIRCTGRTPLDPIDPDLPGCLNARRLEQAILAKWPRTSTRVLRFLDESLMYGDREVHIATRPIYTDVQWFDHLGTLTRVNVCATANDNLRDLLLVAAKYFAVPKGHAEARGVLDAHLVDTTESAPPLHLPSLPQLLIAFAFALASSKKPSIALADLRHMYNQVPLQESVRKYFRIAIQRKGKTCVFYEWCVLPMGFLHGDIDRSVDHLVIYVVCRRDRDIFR